MIEYMNHLGIDIDFERINREIINVSRRNSRFRRLVNELSESLPGDLDFKISPVPIGDDAIPEDYTILNIAEEGDFEDIYRNTSDDRGTNRALDYLATIAEANEDTPLLNRANIDTEIEEIAEALSEAIRNRPNFKVRPGPNTRHLYTQIVQQQHRDDFRGNHRDETYVNFLLNEKEIIRLNTQLNSMCMAIAFNNNDYCPPLISFMFAIHILALRSNAKLNSILWDNDLEIGPGEFNELSVLKRSGLLGSISSLWQIWKNSLFLQNLKSR